MEAAQAASPGNSLPQTDSTTSSLFQPPSSVSTVHLPPRLMPSSGHTHGQVLMTGMPLVTSHPLPTSSKPLMLFLTQSALLFVSWPLPRPSWGHTSLRDLVTTHPHSIQLIAESTSSNIHRHPAPSQTCHSPPWPSWNVSQRLGIGDSQGRAGDQEQVWEANSIIQKSESGFSGKQ